MTGNHWGLLVGFIGGFAAILSNANSIYSILQTWFGEIPAKVSIAQARITLAATKGFRFPVKGFPGVYFLSEPPTPSEGEDTPSPVVIDLEGIKDGDPDEHVKFAEQPEILQLFIMQQLAARELEESSPRYVVVDPFAHWLNPGTLRVAIKKETAGSVKECRVTVNDPEADLVTSFDAVDLEEGKGTHYYHFGILFSRQPEKIHDNLRWDIVLNCKNNGDSVGDGPKELVVVAPYLPQQ